MDWGLNPTGCGKACLQVRNGREQLVPSVGRGAMKNYWRYILLAENKSIHINKLICVSAPKVSKYAKTLLDGEDLI